MQQDSQNPTPKYWMSLEQWRQDPEFRRLAEEEFLSSPLQSEDGRDGWARREFLKLMGASLAMTSFGCVRRPAQKIVPYVKKPADIIHGIPNYYASTYVDGVEGLGILVTTRDGRPIKIEGHPEFPATRGGMSGRAHASILKLYDPDRLTGPRNNLQNETRTNRETVGVKWDDLDAAVIEQLKKGSVALLTPTQASPSTAAVLEDFKSSFGALIFRYDDVGYDDVREASRVSFGRSGLPLVHIERARYILSVNNDFLGTWLTPTAFNRGFSRGRAAVADMNKLVVFESVLSLTGSNADRRFRIRPSQSLEVVMGILRELIVNRKLTRYAADATVQRMISTFGHSSEPDLPLAEIAEDLWNHRGQSVVLAGGLHGGTESSLSLQVAVNFLNSALENVGKTIEPVGAAPDIPGGAIGDLIEAMAAKKVKTLIVHGCNPAYSLPEQAGFVKALHQVEMVIYTGDRNDESGRLADYLAVDHHSLENWGDMVSLDGTYCIQQPTIRPLYDTRAFQESLLIWAKGSGRAPARVKAAETWYEFVKAQSASHAKGRTFDQLLQTGVVPNAVTVAAGGSFSTSALALVKPTARVGGMELALYQTVGLGSGELANVPWLQELPDPVTKVTWDNYACFSPKDAARLRIRQGSFVALTVGERKVRVPAHIQPGQADGVVGLAVGYGRSGAGQVADGVGVNAYQLAQWSGGRRVTAGIEARVQVEPATTELAITQGHHSMEGRQLVVEETLKDHLRKPGGKIHRHATTSMWSEHVYKGHKWGMVIDLNTCTGCSACVIACQSENNIPSVGRRNVINGREMQWIRIDRYYVGSPDEPSVVHQPLPCMHCDNAPCETVCPVVATNHSEEGTNDMIYNRCVGTRYCANNCPYKVRRFNWFNYSENLPEPRKMAMNPDVTVRFRGVMEKCTFCIHRIKAVRSRAKLEDRSIHPGELQTACQQSCPTGAITFGDLNSKEWAVSEQFSSPSSYALLEELNTRPAVRYQVKVRNAAQLKGSDSHHGEGHHA